jgi:ribosomal protein S18 acetylase RimI-like enzyme
MKITIAKAEMKHLEDCKAALMKSRLGLEYFPVEENARAAILEGIDTHEMYVAVNETGDCMGFIFFILKGAFHSFPYLHIVAVKEEFRGLGIGQELLRFFEETVFPEASKVFLVVADFNPEAKRLYEKIGYQQVGAIPSLYREGITEYLMMKPRP